MKGIKKMFFEKDIYGIIGVIWLMLTMFFSSITAFVPTEVANAMITGEGAENLQGWSYSLVVAHDVFEDFQDVLEDLAQKAVERDEEKRKAEEAELALSDKQRKISAI